MRDGLHAEVLCVKVFVFRDQDSEDKWFDLCLNDIGVSWLYRDSTRNLPPTPNPDLVVAMRGSPLSVATLAAVATP